MPVVLPGGYLYGALCCISSSPNPALEERDLQFMRLLAQLVGEHLERSDGAFEEHRRQRNRVLGVLSSGDLHLVYQPILELWSREPVGFEALARFATDPQRSPATWFREAWEVGLGGELELAVVRMAVRELQQGPPTCYLSINVSPQTILSPEFEDALADAPPDRLVLELTEHARIDGYEDLHSALKPLRTEGVRLAIDDTGAGYASLSHILRLSPDVIKLDGSLVRGINDDRARLALASALTAFATRIGAITTAECVENEGEALALQALGIGYAQGHVLGRPGPLRQAECRTG